VSLDYDLLKSLHLKLRLITDIDERIRKGPLKVKVVRSNEAGFLKALEEAKENLMTLRKASKEKQMQLGEREAKIEDLKAKLNTCDSNKEFQLLKDRIAADTQANSVLQDEILEQLEKLDVLEETQNSAKKNYEQSQADTQSVETKVASELKEMEAEKARVSNRFDGRVSAFGQRKRRRRSWIDRYVDLWKLQSTDQSTVCRRVDAKETRVLPGLWLPDVLGRRIRSGQIINARSREN